MFSRGFEFNKNIKVVVFLAEFRIAPNINCTQLAALGPPYFSYLDAQPCRDKMRGHVGSNKKEMASLTNTYNIRSNLINLDRSTSKC